MKLRPFLFLVIMVIIMTISSCQIGRFFYYNFAGIKDYKIFDSRKLNKCDTPFVFATSSRSLIGSDTLDKFLKAHNTVAFLVIQNDSICYEKYFQGFEQASPVASFSMAKSITSILIGCALEDGYIKSLDEPITHYIIELQNKPGFEKITIKHLLQMTSGIEFNESYFNPLSDAAAFYYGTDLKKCVSNLKILHEPGIKFKYMSGNSQLLGFILHYALKGKSVTQYLQEKLWTPLHMEYDASWSVDDKNQIEKTFCCVNAPARDFAKIGRLMLNKGNWNGQQIVSEYWVKESTKIDTTQGSAWFYQHQWWFPSNKGDFMAKGFLGQYIYVNPAKNVIIVRLGKTPGGLKWGKVLSGFAEKL